MKSRPRRDRIRFAVPGALLLLAAAFPGCNRTPARPNILIVVLDTVRRDATGWPTPVTFPEFERVPLTPNLSALGARGTTWKNAWAPAPWTVPSHASLFTGRLPSRHGCTGKHPRLAPDVPVLAEALDAAGYQSAAFFSNPWLADRTTGLLRGFTDRQESPVGSVNSMVTGISFGDQGGAACVAKLAKWLKDRDPHRPFLAFVNILSAHLPYAPFAEDLRQIAPDVETGKEIPIKLAHEYNAGVYSDADMDWHAIRANYAGDVRRADRLLGQILESLQDEDLEKTTTVIVTADHGENLGDHELLEHQFSVHETLLAIPLVVAGPRTPGVGIVRDEPVELTDVYATVLDLAGLPLDDVPAVSHSLLGDPSPPDRPLIAQYAGPSDGMISMMKEINPGLDADRLSSPRRTLRVGSLRLSESDAEGTVLNDLADDPGQKRDLSASRPADVTRLAELLDAVSGPPAEPGQEVTIDEETRRQLESLGYIQGE
jgi:arylsulfatase A-like enzyme